MNINFYTFSLGIHNSQHYSIDEKNPKLIEIYKQKMSEYFERAEYIKKSVIKKDVEPPVVNQGGSGQATKKT